ALVLAGCQGAYEPACRRVGAATVLSTDGPLRSSATLALSLEPGGKVLARWWRPSPAADGGELPSGPTAELALLGADGQVEERSSVLLDGGWEGAPGRNPARPFVRTPDGVAAVVVETRAKVEPDLTVRLRTFLRFTAVSASSGATSTELADTSCLDCELWVSAQRLGQATAVLVAQRLPYDGAGEPPALGGVILSVDGQGAPLGRISVGGSEPLPALVPRTPADALALFSDKTLRLWSEGLFPIGPPMGLTASPHSLDWDLDASELIAGTTDSASLFLEYLAWSGEGRAERHRASSGSSVFAVALGPEGPGVVFGDGAFTWFAHLTGSGDKRGPDVPLPPLEHEDGYVSTVDGRGVLVAVPDAPGTFAYFAPSAWGVDRHEVRCE
ncbi:MAG: hypothetical protein ACYC8T_19610, partial [Myxococcaceae bacterium]